MATKINEQKLLISEMFYSVQCEGISTGVPSVFIRLAMCNLSCGFSPKFVRDFKKEPGTTEAGELVGDLHADGNASWTCDTMPVWIKGSEWEFQEVIDWFKSEGIYEDVLSGKIHIIWTGGEPTIPGHQESIFNFCNYWCDYNNGELDTVFFEIETNGTIEFSKIAPWINQVNCSPKLKNSGMARSQRYRPEVLSWINTHTNCQFKFVISSEEDIEEMFIDFISPIDVMLGNEPWTGIDFESVVCMPGLDSQEDFHERTRWVLEMAKKYKFRGMTRLHVSAWDKTTGC